MATRDLTYLINFDVEGAGELGTAASNMEDLAEATNGVSEDAPSLALDLPDPADIDAVGTSLGDLGANDGPLVTAGDNASKLSGAFQSMIGAIGVVELASRGADIAIGAVKDQLDFIAATDAWSEEQVEGYRASVLELGVGLGAIEDHLTNIASQEFNQAGGLFGLGSQETLENPAASFGALGITISEVMAVIEGGEPELEAFRARLDEIGFGGQVTGQQMAFLEQQQSAYHLGVTTGANELTFYTETQDSANRALQEMLSNRDPMSQFTSEWDLLKESMSDGSIDTTAAANALNTLSDELGLTTDQVLELAQADLDEVAAGTQAFADALNSIDFEAAELQGATTAFTEYTDQLFAAGNEAERREAAFDALAASAEEQALTFNIATEAGRAQQDALEGVARVIDEDLAQAYDEANGSQAAFVASATRLGDETLARLQTELNLTDEQVETLRNTLGLTEGDYEARFALAGAEEARIQLGLLGGAIEGLPDDVEVVVNQQILAGDFVGARDTVANYYADNPVPLSTEVDPAGAEEGLATVAEEAPTATITAEADTAAAATALLDEADRPRTAYIIADALVGIAQGELDDLTNADRTAFIDVATGSVSLPSNSELASQIGTIRIPIQAYWTTRIEGNRPR